MSNRRKKPDPTPQIGDLREDSWLREQYRQFSPEYVQFRLKAGNTLDLYHDSERTDLNVLFSRMTQFCGIKVTLDGRIVDVTEVDAQVEDDIVSAPQAELVVGTHPEELRSSTGRDLPHIATGKVSLYFRNPYRALWDMLEHRAITVSKSKGKDEEARIYEIANPDGTTHTQFRLHQGGKYISRHFPDRVDQLVEIMGQLSDKQAVADALVTVLGEDARPLFDAGEATFDTMRLTQRIRTFGSGNVSRQQDNTDAFLHAMKEAMGHAYPLALEKLPPVNRVPDGATTYYDDDGTRWKKFRSPAYTRGHNVIRYDDRALWADLHRTLDNEVFITHTKNYQRFRVDTLPFAKMAVLLDRGPNRIRPGVKIRHETGEPYEAYTLGSLMKANTRDPLPEMGIDEGVRMPDGSRYEEKYAHKRARYDVMANISLDFYMRRRMPDVAQSLEQHSDFGEMKKFLMMGEGFQPHPLRAFRRDHFPHGAQLHIGVCAFVNEDVHERRQALMIRTDTDQKLEDYRFRGKRLAEMTADELAVMLKAQHRQPDALCEVLDLRKNPPVVEAELAFNRGLGGDPETHEANRRFVLAHPELVKNLLQAHTQTMPPMPDWRSVPNPRPEEQLFTGLTELKPYQFKVHGKTVRVPEDVHNEAVKKVRQDRNIDQVIRRAVRVQPIEFETRLDSLEAFVERIKSVDQQLLKYVGRDSVPYFEMPDPPEDASEEEIRAYEAGLSSPFTMLPPPERPFIPRKFDYVPNPEKPKKMMRVKHVVGAEECAVLTANAVEYLWAVRAELMDQFHDSNNRYVVQDSRGHEVSFPDFYAMNPADRSHRLTSGEYRIVPERLNYSAELMARMFRNAGRVEWAKEYYANRGNASAEKNQERWERLLKAVSALNVHGAPNEDPDLARWMTAAKGKKEAERILHNLRQGDLRALDDEWGLWDIFMSRGDEAEQIMQEYLKLVDRQEKRYPLTPENMALVGYDPETKLPIEYARYNIPADAETITIDVPDRMLEQPLKHHEVASNILFLDPTPEQRAALAKAGPNTHLFVRGAQSGLVMYAARPALLKPQEISPNHYFSEVYSALNTRYIDSGMEAPPFSQLVPIAVDALEPVPAPIDPAIQTVKLRWEDFLGTVSPVLGYRDEKLTGFVVKHYGFTPQAGPARLQGLEKSQGKSTPGESGREVPAHISQVRSMTLKNALERINLGREQLKAAVAFGLHSVEELRQALKHGNIAEEQIRGTTFKNLAALERLAARKSFTARDAVHYGYAGLTDMRSKLIGLFNADERATNRDDNIVHFVDIDPVTQGMQWHLPSRRSRVRVLSNDNAPDPTDVHGGPAIERSRQPRAKLRA